MQAGDDNATPLHLATLKGHLRVVESLLQRGAPPGAVDDAGRSALHTAALTGSEAMVALLLRHGTPVSTPDAKGWHPLHAASVSASAVPEMSLGDAVSAPAGELSADGYRREHSISSSVALPDPIQSFASSPFDARLRAAPLCGSPAGRAASSSR